MFAYFENRNLLRSKFMTNFKAVNVCAPHFHQDIELLYINEGTKEVTINQKTVTLLTGQLAIADSFDIHSFPIRSEEASSILIIPPKYLVNFIGHKRGKKLTSNYILNPTINYELFKIFQKIEANLNSNEVLLQGLIDTLLGEILSIIPLTDSDKNDAPDTIREIIIYINKHYNENINLNEIAKAFGYSPSYFSRLFNRYISDGLIDYVNTVRLGHLINYMKAHPESKLSEVIFDMGFNCEQTFYRSFRKHYNCTLLEALSSTRGGLL